MADLCNGAFDDMVDSTLKRRKKDKSAAASTDVTIKGAYVIVDNGSLTWLMTIPPMKATCNRSELRFSQWLKELGKSVDFSFGILQGCWRIIKTGIRVHSTEVSDDVRMTCCSSHNLLTEVDGLPLKWERRGCPS